MKGNFILSVVFSVLIFSVVCQKFCSENKPPAMALDCCPNLPKVIDSLLNETCFKKYLKNTQTQLKDLGDDEIPKGDCVLECIANRTKVYRGSGIIDHIHLKRIFMNSVVGDREWGNIASEAVDICVNETRIMFKKFKMNFTRSFDGEVVCHPISGYVMGCLQTVLFQKCPNMTETPECDGLKTYAMSCQLGFKYI